MLKFVNYVRLIERRLTYLTIESAKKYVMGLTLHNCDSQMQSVSFWPFEQNKYIFIKDFSP